MARRYYSSTAVETTLSGAISNSATSITVTALSGFPNTTPWTAIIDADTASEELVEVTNVAGTTLTVTRGVDGTAAVSHNAGASFRHGVSARDFDEANDHVNDSTGVHGIGSGSSVVGTTDTQTLTNKTIDIASNTLTGVAPVANPTFTGVASFPDGSASAPSITNTGDTNTGIAFPAEDTLAISTGGTERVRVNSTGLVGVGTDSPAAILNVTTDSATVVRLENNSTNATGVDLQIFKRRGTKAAPTIVAQNDILGSIAFRGFDGSLAREAAIVRAEVDGTPGSGDMPGRLMLFTTADGAATPTERLRIDSNGLITGTGTSLGAWTAYTPTLGGTGWAIGDGTAVGYVFRIGKFVRFNALITFGSTSTYGAVALRVSIPDAGVGVGQTLPGIGASLFDTSLSQYYTASVGAPASGFVSIRAIGTNGLESPTSSTNPFTWASGDQVLVSGTYEAA